MLTHVRFPMLGLGLGRGVAGLCRRHLQGLLQGGGGVGLEAHDLLRVGFPEGLHLLGARRSGRGLGLRLGCKLRVKFQNLPKMTSR